jgi:hypothetical protein
MFFVKLRRSLLGLCRGTQHVNVIVKELQQRFGTCHCCNKFVAPSTPVPFCDYTNCLACAPARYVPAYAVVHPTALKCLL